MQEEEVRLMASNRCMLQEKQRRKQEKRGSKMMDISTFPYLAFEYFKSRVFRILAKPGRFFLKHHKLIATNKGLYLKINARRTLLIV